MLGECMVVCSVMLIAHCDHPNLKVQTSRPLMLSPFLLRWDLFHPFTKKRRDMIITMAPGQMSISHYSGDKLLSVS